MELHASTQFTLYQICKIQRMSESHIILTASTPTDNPKRQLCIELTVKGGICRSCRQTLIVGEPRIRVMYPNMIVQYSARIGAPSFFMHPKCFETNPVDFWRIGTAAYKETTPIAGFSLNPEVDVVGWDKFPELHHCFSKCQELLEAQQVASVGSSPICHSLMECAPSFPVITASEQSEAERSRATATIIHIRSF